MKPKLLLKPMLNLGICLSVLTVFFLTRKDSTFLVGLLEMVRLPIICFVLTLILYNGQSQNKKGPFQKQDNKRIYLCTQKMTKTIWSFMEALTMKITRFTRTSTSTKLKLNIGSLVTVFQWIFFSLEFLLQFVSTIIEFMFLEDTTLMWIYKKDTLMTCMKFNSTCPLKKEDPMQSHL